MPLQDHQHHCVTAGDQTTEEQHESASDQCLDENLLPKWALLAKSDQKKWHFEWPNQNSKTTFIVQTFPKYGPYGFDLVNLSLLGPILAKFQFC